LAAAFLKGLLYSITAVVIHFLFGNLFSESLHPLAQYLFYVYRDHLFPFVLLCLFVFTVLKASTTLEIVSFATGFYSLLSVIEVVLKGGRFDAYTLFLLPAMRMATILFLPLLQVRYREWYGWFRVMFLFAVILIPFGKGAVSLLYMRFYPEAAGACVAVMLLGALLFFVLGKEH
jgi:hypothetical protein